jgi:hypothetical protein
LARRLFLLGWLFFVTFLLLFAARFFTATFVFLLALTITITIAIASRLRAIFVFYKNNVERRYLIVIYANLKQKLQMKGKNRDISGLNVSTKINKNELALKVTLAPVSSCHRCFADAFE